MKIFKKSLVLMLALYLATAFFTSTVIASVDRSCCVVECLCMSCRCVYDCYCKQECDHSEVSCFVCEAVVKRREMPTQQIIAAAQCNMCMCDFFTKLTVNFDIFRTCTTSIVEDKVRMNN